MNAPTPSSDPSNAAPHNAPSANRTAGKRRRIFLYLGLTALGGLLLAGLVVLISARYGLNAFTSATPLSSPTMAMAAADEDQLHQKLDAFSDSFENGQATTLELSAPELNAVLIEHTSLRARILVTITDGQLCAQVSVPLELVLGAQGQNRWLNGEATLTIAAQDGQVHLHVTTLAVNGRSLPRRLLDALARLNLAAEAALDATTADYVRRVERVTVENEKLMIHFKAA